ncbi:MAG: dTDP-4-dehydrorhamnose 3,5-epimerase [Planctomycetes bacterium]|nr:dTDP-4-dehydrorhamnose 3,5-epimerase [Planctomycetota bacterium]
MRIEETSLPGLLLIHPDVFGDERGYFLELWNGGRYAPEGLDATFVQDNLSFSRRGVLRGLHFQEPLQGKLLTVLQGEVYDVALDIRLGSPTFGRWEGFSLRGEAKTQLYVPEGFAHGFAVVSETALFYYKCTTAYNPAGERSVLWNDPDLGIDWPVKNPELSARDQKGTPLAQFPRERLPIYGG